MWLSNSERSAIQTGRLDGYSLSPGYRSALRNRVFRKVDDLEGDIAAICENAGKLFDRSEIEHMKLGFIKALGIDVSVQTVFVPSNPERHPAHKHIPSVTRFSVPLRALPLGDVVTSSHSQCICCAGKPKWRDPPSITDHDHRCYTRAINVHLELMMDRPMDSEEYDFHRRLIEEYQRWQSNSFPFGMYPAGHSLPPGYGDVGVSMGIAK